MVAQLIIIYNNDNFNINMEDGSTASGFPLGLTPASEQSLLKLSNGANTELVSLCKIASIGITSATYSTDINYLPVPTEPLECCEAYCESGIRKELPVGTKALIKAGGQSGASKTVAASEYGMIAVTGPKNSSPEFFVSCKIETIKV